MFGITPDAKLANIVARLDDFKIQKLLDRAYDSRQLQQKNKPEIFIKWFLSKNIELPMEFVEFAAKDSIQKKEDSLTFNRRTKLLEELLKASNKFWTNYDPTDKESAPLNYDVSQWLVNERNIPKRVADVMAQILRADNLPVGRR